MKTLVALSVFLQLSISISCFAAAPSASPASRDRNSTRTTLDTPMRDESPGAATIGTKSSNNTATSSCVSGLSSNASIIKSSLANISSPVCSSTNINNLTTKFASYATQVSSLPKSCSSLSPINANAVATNNAQIQQVFTNFKSACTANDSNQQTTILAQLKNLIDADISRYNKWN